MAPEILNIVEKVRRTPGLSCYKPAISRAALSPQPARPPALCSRKPIRVLVWVLPPPCQDRKQIFEENPYHPGFYDEKALQEAPRAPFVTLRSVPRTRVPF